MGDRMTDAEAKIAATQLRWFARDEHKVPSEESCDMGADAIETLAMVRAQLVVDDRSNDDVLAAIAALVKS